jgi:hypothetical protein
VQAENLRHQCVKNSAAMRFGPKHALATGCVCEGRHIENRRKCNQMQPMEAASLHNEPSAQFGPTDSTHRRDFMTTSAMSASPTSLSWKQLVMALAALAASVATLSVAAPDASASKQSAPAAGAPAPLSEGVDWSRVAVAPVTTGMSIAAYER